MDMVWDGSLKRSLKNANNDLNGSFNHSAVKFNRYSGNSFGIGEQPAKRLRRESVRSVANESICADYKMNGLEVAPARNESFSKNVSNKLLGVALAPGRASLWCFEQLGDVARAVGGSAFHAVRSAERYFKSRDSSSERTVSQEGVFPGGFDFNKSSNERRESDDRRRVTFSPQVEFNTTAQTPSPSENSFENRQKPLRSCLKAKRRSRTKSVAKKDSRNESKLPEIVEEHFDSSIMDFVEKRSSCGTKLSPEFPKKRLSFLETTSNEEKKLSLRLPQVHKPPKPALQQLADMNRAPAKNARHISSFKLETLDDVKRRGQRNQTKILSTGPPKYKPDEYYLLKRYFFVKHKSPIDIAALKAKFVLFPGKKFKQDVAVNEFDDAGTIEITPEKLSLFEAAQSVDDQSDTIFEDVPDPVTTSILRNFERKINTSMKQLEEKIDSGVEGFLREGAKDELQRSVSRASSKSKSPEVVKVSKQRRAESVSKATQVVDSEKQVETPKKLSAPVFLPQFKPNEAKKQAEVLTGKQAEKPIVSSLRPNKKRTSEQFSFGAGQETGDASIPKPLVTSAFGKVANNPSGFSFAKKETPSTATPISTSASTSATEPPKAFSAPTVTPSSVQSLIFPKFPTPPTTKSDNPAPSFPTFSAPTTAGTSIFAPPSIQTEAKSAFPSLPTTTISGASPNIFGSAKPPSTVSTPAFGLPTSTANTAKPFTAASTSASAFTNSMFNAKPITKSSIFGGSNAASSNVSIPSFGQFTPTSSQSTAAPTSFNGFASSQTPAFGFGAKSSITSSQSTPNFANFNNQASTPAFGAPAAAGNVAKPFGFAAANVNVFPASNNSSPNINSGGFGFGPPQSNVMGAPSPNTSAVASSSSNGGEIGSAFRKRITAKRSLGRRR